MKPLFALLLFFGGRTAFAFPEMVRAGYQNCTACHVSPSGGGSLTEYGRSMSNEILSTWGYKGEETVGHGLFHDDLPKWLQVGGDVRWIRVAVQMDDERKHEQFVMESNLELALKVQRLQVVGSAGAAGGPSDDPDHGKFISKRHYALYSLNDESYLRAGKYEVPFGINQPNHTVVTRQGLGWNEGSETYNAEAGYIGEQFNAILTIDLGRIDDRTSYAESGNGLALNFAYNLGEKSKLGWSAFKGSVASTQKYMTGPYGILGFTKHFVLLSEFVYQWQLPSEGLEKKGPAIYNRLQYEFVKGVHGFVEAQFAKTDANVDSSELSAYAAGINFYPRPHFEFIGQLGKLRVGQGIGKFNDIGWVQGHYYF